MDHRFHDTSMPRQILPGETVSGFVFTHADPGTKAFNVDVFGAGNTQAYHFTFFIDVPGFVADHAEVDFKGLYAEEEIKDFDIPGFRSALDDVAVFATNRAGEQPGLPVNVVFVNHGLYLLQAVEPVAGADEGRWKARLAGANQASHWQENPTRTNQ